ncbi:gliding motility-associated C-terminal domain-containing protein [Taibaiella koreensis]|uniref:gliding motility-associated C-terminal domain-containing protein n=1 Tax=Taibaiella koreensis TaxID=1268548 RepID=UPI000E59B0B6|nr:gliding motility-associated C-terminal domain-containing protein [Taibaiella koreensis]
MKRILLILGICCLLQHAFAQKQGNIWYFGQRAGLDFNTTPPTPLTGMLTTAEGCASIADPATGQPLFYTDGITVWDRTNTPMPGSLTTPLNGDPSSTQSGVIVPVPGSSSIYYIVTTPAEAGFYSLTAAMCYSVVDLSLNGGNGDLVSVNNILMDSSTEKIAVTGNCDGTGYWVLGHRWNCDSFYAFKLTSAGFDPPVKSRSGSVPALGASAQTSESIGYMKFSANGRRLGMATYSPQNSVELFDFDGTTGIVSNPVIDVFPAGGGFLSDGAYGCSFSPDNSKFYVSVYSTPQNKIYQYDVEAGSGAAIIASRILVATSVIPLWALQNGPDGKMYIAVGGRDALDVIEHPNAAGLACSYTQGAITLAAGTVSSLGLPCMVESFLSPIENPSFTLPSDSVICLGDTLDAPQREHSTFSITPASSVIVSADSSLVRFAPRVTTTYTILKRNICKGYDTLRFTVHIAPGPVADFVFAPAEPTLYDKQLRLVNRSSGAVTYAWYDQEWTWLSAETDYAYPIHKEEEPCFTLVAKDRFQCADTATKCVGIKDVHYVIFTPNSFSPNGDGRNDVFRISGVNIQLESLAIFNRYGERVFLSNDIDKGWDGNFNGKGCDAGTYFYLIRYKIPTGETLKKKGDVILIR